MFSFLKKKALLTRKERSEAILRQHGLKINAKLPNIEPDVETIIRPVAEIARRVTILCTNNLVAFNSITGDQAKGFLERFDLWDDVTPKERDFLADPTDEKKNNETWKCECIWILMWALGQVDNLEFPDTMCDLADIPQDRYPIVPNKDPNDFIKTMITSRTKKEILDANDLYYRYEWACVDARINSQEMLVVNPGIVYERHFALNWLIHYRDQNWDEVSCDT